MGKVTNPLSSIFFTICFITLTGLFAVADAQEIAEFTVKAGTYDRKDLPVHGSLVGLSDEHTQFSWKIEIPEEYYESHEEHFTRVTQQFLEDLDQGSISEWERTNLLTKYYITTQEYEQSHN